LFGLSLLDGQLFVVLPLLLLFFIAFNYLEASLPSLMTKTVSEEARGMGSGLFSSCQFLGAACGGITAGWLYDIAGVSAIFMSCAAFALLWYFIARPMRMPQILAQNVVA